jgi:hypothetical protein
MLLKSTFFPSEKVFYKEKYTVFFIENEVLTGFNRLIDVC